MSLGESLSQLDVFLTSFQKARKKDPPPPVALMIICPDCGKNPPFRNRCPKCGGDSWIPAGPVNGIFEWVKARQWRFVISPPPPAPSREVVPEEAVNDTADTSETKVKDRKRKRRSKRKV